MSDASSGDPSTDCVVRLLNSSADSTGCVVRLLNSSADSTGCVVKLLNSSADILQVMTPLFASEGAMCCVGKLRPFLWTARLTAKSRASACSETAG